MKGKGENIEKYGVMYSFSTAQIACPNGWHLPSKKEWNQLIATIPSKENSRGGRMFSKKDILDSTRYNIQLAGFRSADGTYRALNQMTIFWTSSDTTLVNMKDARFNGKKFIGYHFYLSISDSVNAEPTYANAHGTRLLAYCRCIKDAKSF